MSEKLIGTKPNQVPTNSDLGEMAYQNKDDVTLAAASKSSLTVKRKDDDGDLVKLKRDVTTAGQLGVYASGTGAYLNGTSLLSLRIAGGDMLTLTNSNLYPTSDSGVNLGLSNRHFANLHMSGTAYIDGAIESASYSHLDDLPDVRPSLLLDFANSKTLDPRITFTRGSTATYWDGKTTTKAEENLISNSRYTGGSGWNSGNYTEYQDHATAPDGTTTATKVSPNSSAAGISVAIGTGIGNGGDTITWSIYAKQDSTDYPAISMYFNSASAARATFDITNGTIVGTTGGTGTVTASIVDAGNGWYRCIATFSGATTGECTFYVMDAADNNDFSLNNSPDGTKGMLVWGPQVEKRSSATAYTPTTSNPIVKYQPTLQTAASGEARFDHDPVTGESKGLLIEESRTNNLPYSEDLTHAAWIKNACSITANTAIAPDGTQTADKLVENTATASHDLRDNQTLSTSTEYTYSFYAKADGRSIITYYLALTGSAAGGEFNLATGTATSGYMEDVGNGWYRCWTTHSTTSSGGAYNMILILNNGSSTNYTGNGYSGVYIWGVQLEQGAFPTSYIATSGSSATRALDMCTFLDLSKIDYNQGNGTTLLVEGQARNNGLRGLINFSGGNEVNFYGICETIGSVDGRLRSSSTYEVINSTVSGLSAGDYFTSAMSIDFNSLSARTATNGTVSTEDTSFSQTVPANINRLAIGTISSSTYALNGCIKKAAVYPKAFNSATITAMTEE